MYKVTSSKLAYESRCFTVIDEGIELPDGKATTRQIVRHPGAAVILPQRNDGMLLLVNQYRHAVGGMLLEFPAGTLELEEDPVDCARREIQEEVGYRADEWISLGILYPAPGFCDEKQHLFLAKELSPQTAPGDEDEIIEVKIMSVSEVEQAIRQEEIRDAKSIAIFYRARLNGLL